MHQVLEFSHAPLAAGSSEAALVTAMLRFEQDVLVPRPGFDFHALLRSDDGVRYAHLVATSDPRALQEVAEQAERLPAFRSLVACLDAERMVMQHHRPLEAFSMPPRFAALEVGTFALRDGAGSTASELVRRAAALRDGYLSRAPECLAQVVCSLGGDRYSEIVCGDSLAHVRQTCAGYLHDRHGQALVELAEPSSCELTYWVPLLLRDLSALRARSAA